MQLFSAIRHILQHIHIYPLSLCGAILGDAHVIPIDRAYQLAAPTERHLAHAVSIYEQSLHGVFLDYPTIPHLSQHAPAHMALNLATEYVEERNFVDVPTAPLTK